MRIRYIGCIWKNANLCTTTNLLPEDYRWKQENNKLTFCWFDGNQLPDAYIDIIGNEDLDSETVAGIYRV